MNREVDQSEMRARTLGRAWLGPSFDYLLFLRPRQWLILTFQLAVGVMLAPACADFLQGETVPAISETAAGTQGSLTLRTLFMAWMIWVVCLNGGTLAFNSAFDRDTEDIAYLRRPPAPPPHLAFFSLALMLFGAGAAWGVSPLFAWVTGFCVLLSVFYSHPITRWKGLPGLDLTVNMIGYGGGTTLAGLAAGAAAFGAFSEPGTAVDTAGWFAVAAFALLFGSLYPLTQLYQIEDDRQRGDRTLASFLGTRGSLVLALVLSMAAEICFLGAAWFWPGSLNLARLVTLLTIMTVWQLHLVIWLIRAPHMSDLAHEHGMYRALALWAAMDIAVLVSRYFCCT